LVEIGDGWQRDGVDVDGSYDMTRSVGEEKARLAYEANI
jgi:hypothetical protein